MHADNNTVMDIRDLQIELLQLQNTDLQMREMRIKLLQLQNAEF